MKKEKYPFRLGIHPINWIGEDVKEHGERYTYQNVLDDIQGLGFAGTEMSRKFPRNSERLKKELDMRGIQLISQWKSTRFSDSTSQREELSSYREHAYFLHEMGSDVISTAEIRNSSIEGGSRRLTDDEWKWLVEGLNRAGEIAQEYGMKLTYHHHAGTVVEQSEEIDKLMEMTDPKLVYLLYDTGHAVYGGNDPMRLLRKYYERIAYIHLKDVRQGILDEARMGNVDFLSCIRKGIFTVPGDGSIDFVPILHELFEREYSGWAVFEGEQDPDKNDPVLLARRALGYVDRIMMAKVGNIDATYV